MALSQAKLIKKIPLTQDVYELHYDTGEEKKMIPGQFITFILPEIGGRAYSILKLQGSIVKLIIKRWSADMGGRGGSIKLCDGEVGEVYNFVGPVGHFILTHGDINRCFLGTGTGFVPLYNQILGSLERGDCSKVHFVFGVRKAKDLFYTEELEKLSKKYVNFSYSLYLSQENFKNTQQGYVTDYIDTETMAPFDEYYICGAPAMIDAVQNKLSDFGISEEKVFFEKY